MYIDKSVLILSLHSASCGGSGIWFFWSLTVQNAACLLLIAESCKTYILTCEKTSGSSQPSPTQDIDTLRAHTHYTQAFTQGFSSSILPTQSYVGHHHPYTHPLPLLPSLLFTITTSNQPLQHSHLPCFTATTPLQDLPANHSSPHPPRTNSHPRW